MFRNDLMELIQYAPQTETVYEIPLLCSPPWINKYYVMDLAPGRSFVEWAVQHGHTVFAISYRNPDESMRDVTLDDYLLDGPRAALDGDRGDHRVTAGEHRRPLSRRHAHDDAARVSRAGGRSPRPFRDAPEHAVDFSEPGVLGVFTDESTIAGLEAKMQERGFLDSSEMSRTFTLLRANDLVWNYVVNNWLLGEEPPPFDILAWNDDDTRMPAAMHSFYLRSCYVRNEFAQGTLELRGQRAVRPTVKNDTYVLAASEDHIAPWQASYKTGGLLGGHVRFVLSSAGHIAGIVNPPGPKAWYEAADFTGQDPEAGAGATQAPGLVVGGLGGLDRVPRRRADQAAAPGQQAAPGHRGRPRGVRVRLTAACACRPHRTELTPWQT